MKTIKWMIPLLLFITNVLALEVSSNGPKGKDTINDLFNSDEAALDINGDQIPDLFIKKYFGEMIHQLIWQPSWNNKEGRIEIDKGIDVSERRIFKNDQLIEKIINERNFAGNLTRFYHYQNEVAHKKSITLFYPKQAIKEIHHFTLKNETWSLAHVEKEDIITWNQELNGNSHDEDWCNEFFPENERVDAPFSNFRPRIRFTGDRYIHSKMGFRIDKESCPPDAIKQIGEAIKEMRTKYIPCLQGYRPTFAGLLLMDLWEHESKINCRAQKDGVAADTYTWTGARINIYGLSKSGNFYSNNLANTLMHEVLHHHLDSCKHHNTDVDEIDSIKDKTVRYDDAVYGCTEMCEYDLTQKQNRLTEKGCQECLSDKFDTTHNWQDIFNQDNLSIAEAKRRCLEHPRIRRIKLCEKYEKRKNCSKSLLDAFEHPQFSECRRFYDDYEDIEEADCQSITQIEKTLKPRFRDCYENLRGRGFKGSGCMSTFIDIFDNPKFDDCLKNYGNDQYACRSGYLLNREIHDDCKNLITPSERRTCMYDKYGSKYTPINHHGGFGIFGGFQGLGFGGMGSTIKYGTENESIIDPYFQSQ